jgi:hypothetical protein
MPFTFGYIVNDETHITLYHFVILHFALSPRANT